MRNFFNLSKKIFIKSGKFTRVCVFFLSSLISYGIGINIAQAEEGAKQEQVSEGPMVNINTATAAEFATLPGIGPSKAEAIVKKREAMGKFKRIEAIMRVKGIGRGTFKKIQHRLTVGEEETKKRKNKK